MSTRISRKNLLAEGQRLDGIKLDGNCYQFENAIHFISCLKDVPAGSYLCGANDDRINNIIAEIKKAYPETKGCSATQLFYSAGTYGSNGQLYKMEILDKEWNATGEKFYIYF